MLGLSMITIACDEFADTRGQTSATRRKELKQLFQQQMPVISGAPAAIMIGASFSRPTPSTHPSDSFGFLPFPPATSHLHRQASGRSS